MCRNAPISIIFWLDKSPKVGKIAEIQLCSVGSHLGQIDFLMIRFHLVQHSMETVVMGDEFIAKVPLFGRRMIVDEMQDRSFWYKLLCPHFCGCILSIVQNVLRSCNGDIVMPLVTRSSVSLARCIISTDGSFGPGPSRKMAAKCSIYGRKCFSRKTTLTRVD